MMIVQVLLNVYKHENMPTVKEVGLNIEKAFNAMNRIIKENKVLDEDYLDMILGYQKMIKKGIHWLEQRINIRVTFEQSNYLIHSSVTRDELFKGTYDGMVGYIVNISKFYTT